MVTKDQNITIIRKLFDDVYSKGNFATMDLLFANDVRLVDAASPNFKGGLAALKEKETLYRKAFPNLSLKINDIFSSDDKVVAYWTATGTHKGELQGIPPSGKNFNVTGISIYTLKDNKITFVTQVWDRLALLEQIGEVQPALALHR